MEFFDVITMVQALSLSFSKTGLLKHGLISAAVPFLTFFVKFFSTTLKHTLQHMGS